MKRFVRRAHLVELAPFTPVAVGAVAVAALLYWIGREPALELERRVPGRDRTSANAEAPLTNPILEGKRVAGPGQPSTLPGLWPQFRGPDGTGIASGESHLARSWEGGRPRELWSVDLGEGYAGAAVWQGRVYVMDYDMEQRADALRCLSLADGQEIWRFTYPLQVKRNHGMSRAVPAVTEKHLVAMGPKCHVICLDPVSGELRWGIDLGLEQGTKVPPWYAGQCPLIVEGVTILAPGGKEALLMAVDCETGKVLWRTPNPRSWEMTHASVVPMEFAGRRLYVYCASKGVVGVSAEDGALLWETTDWKISIATIASPVILEGGRIFLSGGYNAGSLMLQMKEKGDKLTVETLFRLEPEVFGATQQTPIYHGGLIYGVRPDGQFVCLDPEGKVVWSSGPGQEFGLGPFLLAEGLFYVLNDTGDLSLVEAGGGGYKRLAHAKVLQGRESWGPLALAGGRLLARDLTRMVCLQVGAP